MVRFDSAFAGADCDSYRFPQINKIEKPPIRFAYIERPQYQDVWNYCDYGELGCFPTHENHDAEECKICEWKTSQELDNW